MAVVRELLTRLGFQVNDSQLRRYEGSVNRIKDNANAAAESFQKMFIAFVGIGALRSLGQVADTMQSLEAQVSQLPQTIGDAGAAFDEVAHHATLARSAIEPYADFFIKASHATKSFFTEQSQVLAMTDALGAALVATGTKAQQQSEVLFQLGQAIGSPTVQMEEMNTVIDGSSQLFNALGRALGYADGQFKKAIGDGKVTGQQLAKAIVAIGPEFEARFKSMPMNLSQAQTIIANRWAVFINRMNRESKAVTAIANLFLGTFDKIESGLESLTDFFGGATNTLKFFAIAITAAVLPALVRLGVGFLAFLASPAGLLIAGLTLIGLALEDVFQWMTGGRSITEDFFGPFSQYSEDAKALSDSLVESFNAIKKAISDVGTALKLNFDKQTLDVVKQNTIDTVKAMSNQWIGFSKILAGVFGQLSAFSHWDPEAFRAATRTAGEGVSLLAKGIVDEVKGKLGVGGALLFGASDDTSKRGLVGAFADLQRGVNNPATAPLSAAGIARTPVSSLRIENNITVPPGTPQQQVDFLNRSAKESAQKNYGDLARYFGQVGQ